MRENYKLCCVQSGVRKKALSKTWIRVRVRPATPVVVTGIAFGLQIETPNPDLGLRER